VLEVAETPDDLTDEQIDRLDAALAMAAERAALPPSADGGDPSAGIVTASPTNLDKTQQVINIIGVDQLKRHAMIYLTQNMRTLQRVSDTR